MTNSLQETSLIRWIRNYESNGSGIKPAVGGGTTLPHGSSCRVFFFFLNKAVECLEDVLYIRVLTMMRSLVTWLLCVITGSCILHGANQWMTWLMFISCGTNYWKLWSVFLNTNIVALANERASPSKFHVCHTLLNRVCGTNGLALGVVFCLPVPHSSSTWCISIFYKTAKKKLHVNLHVLCAYKVSTKNQLIVWHV
jgi:hypothetical protein